MRNQIREKDDGTFEIGKWLINKENKVMFIEVAEADDLKQAIDLADVYDDMDFQQAKFEVDRIGGIDTAQKILNELVETKTVAVFFKKDNFHLDQLRYVDQAAFEEWMDITSKNNGISNEDFVGEWELKNNLKTIRFLSL
ncbi:hypothetical protein [Comamonas sp.]|uniref:hypothetical protein n=1 Tax=Comamonas sp. TaxID=34028 RepID=UPI0012C334F9|nr:hypothetical protein [Comamonas sp.]MPS92783.1 hypothetical protein [Comamonas sp.]